MKPHVALVGIIPLLLAALALAMPHSAHAACIVTGPNPGSAQQIEHKLGHTLINFTAVTATTALTDNVWGGVALAVGIDLAREYQKASTPGMRCEYSSMAFDALGIALGVAAVHHWDIGSTRRGEVHVSYTTEF